MTLPFPHHNPFHSPGVYIYRATSPFSSNGVFEFAKCGTEFCIRSALLALRNIHWNLSVWSERQGPRVYAKDHFPIPKCRDSTHQQVRQPPPYWLAQPTSSEFAPVPTEALHTTAKARLGEEGVYASVIRLH
ncbi:hypothetical protein NMY22_g10277 [Coprinellus aureogranulatus]|nr:hypothetical protein NMY22_g10277 [Coprinellus aureogranulatus]